MASSVPRCTGSRGPTHNAVLKAAVVSQQGHTFTLIWLPGYSEFVLPAGNKTDNLNRRCSLVLMSHACSKNHSLTSLMFEWHENGFLRLTVWAQTLCPKGTITQKKKTVITQCIWWGCVAESTGYVHQDRAARVYAFVVMLKINKLPVNVKYPLIIDSRDFYVLFVCKV